jgi:hypothetical protein
MKQFNPFPNVSNVWGVWGWIDGRSCCAYVRASSRADALDKVRKGAV